MDSYYCRIYDPITNTLYQASDVTLIDEVLSTPFEDIELRCEHNIPAGNCGNCAVGNPMQFHLSESEADGHPKDLDESIDGDDHDGKDTDDHDNS